MIRHGLLPGVDHAKAVRNYIKALNKGILKVMSKMGISTLQSYCGAQIFEAIGLNRELVDRYFTGTASRVERHRHRRDRRGGPPAPRAAFPTGPTGHARARLGRRVPVAPRRRVPPVQSRHRRSSSSTPRARGSYRIFKEYTQAGRRPEPAACATLRGLLELRPAGDAGPDRRGRAGRGDRQALRHRRHVVRLDQPGGARDAGDRDEPHRRQVEHRRGRRGPGALPAATPNGDWRRSAIKQVASARFGVTSEYLVNADELQIKMAQGAKPGEGGQLPGHKVYPWIAKVRYSTPGVGLISPPPHHDIYSIEDLAQLIHDLKNSNPQARDSREAGRRGRRRHRRGGRGQGARRRRADLRPRRRHRRLAAHVDQARRRAVGARPRRDAAGARAERAARPHRRAGRRPAEDRPRRGHRRAARRRGVRLRDGAAGRRRAAS